MIELKPGVELWKHQKLAVEWLVEKRQALLAAKMRTGKTLAALAACSELGVSRILVVTTKRGVQVWADEIEKFTNASYVQLDGDESVASKAQKIWGKENIVILNYDILWREPIHAAILIDSFEAVIMDESHRIKATNSKVSKAAAKLSQKIPIRFALTGTPMPNGPMDIFGQARFINKNSFGTGMLNSFNRFRARYAELLPIGGVQGVYKIIGYKNMDEFNNFMNQFTMQISDDVLDMPDQVFTDVPVILPKKVWEMYKTLNKESLVELESGPLTVDNTLVKTTRLAQIAGGFLAGQFVHDEKIKIVEELIESMPNEPFIIFCRFTDEINALYNRLSIKNGYKVARLTGKHNTLADFQNLNANIILVQINAGAEAISLVQSGYVINYSVGYSLGVFEQAMARPRGAGQTRDRIFYYNLIAKGTIDEAIYKAIKTKGNIRDAIFEQIRSIE